MDKIKLVYPCALVLVFNLSLVYNQQPQSPCPAHFTLNYTNDERQYYGKVKVQRYTSETNIKLNFSIVRPKNDGAIIELENEKEACVEPNVCGDFPDLEYLIYFPEASSLPRLTSISVDGENVCWGPAISRWNQTVTTLSLNHTACLKKPGDQNYTTYESPFTFNLYKPPQFSQSLLQQKPQSPSNIECGRSTSFDNRFPVIKGGRTYIRRGDHPWLVAIYRKIEGRLKFICGGTLVSNTHVVTAAQCLHAPIGLSVSDLVVKLGAHNVNDLDDVIPVTRTLLNASTPDSFDNSTLKNDIMVLTLNEPVEFNIYISPACLWDGDIAPEHIFGLLGTIPGWRNQGNVGTGIREPLLVKVPIVDTDTCRFRITAFQTFTSDKTICTGYRNASAAFTGDSGGGLLLLDEKSRWTLRGVVSAYIRDQLDTDNFEEYTVYTDTAQYLPWLRQVLKTGN